MDASPDKKPLPEALANLRRGHRLIGEKKFADADKRFRLALWHDPDCYEA